MSFYEDYALITGDVEFGMYKSPEDEASKIEKCTILKSVDFTYGNRIEGYTQNENYYVL